MVSVNLALDDELYAELNRVAAADGITAEEAARRTLKAALQARTRQNEISAMIDQAMARDDVRAVIDALGR